MNVYHIEIRGRWSVLANYDIAARTLEKAMEIVRRLARKEGRKRISFISIVQTAQLDA